MKATETMKYQTHGGKNENILLLLPTYLPTYLGFNGHLHFRQTFSNTKVYNRETHLMLHH